jgi:hypothetical protein
MYNEMSGEPISTDSRASYCVRHTVVTVRVRRSRYVHGPAAMASHCRVVLIPEVPSGLDVPDGDLWVNVIESTAQPVTMQ